MLVLTRKPGETVVVPEMDLRITVLGIGGNKVRLGFTAPAGVVVHREEVWQRIGSAVTVQLQEESPRA